MMPTRILLADDHARVRRGLRMVLDAQPDLKVVAEAGDGAQAIELGLRPDIELAVSGKYWPGRGAGGSVDATRA